MPNVEQLEVSLLGGYNLQWLTGREIWVFGKQKEAFGNVGPTSCNGWVRAWDEET
jgi:hypothetical protein